MEEKEKKLQTQFVQLNQEESAAPQVDPKKVLQDVYAALKEKGYNPVIQIVGYIMSGDPTYITNYQNARSLIMKAERDELLSVLVEYYIDNAL